MSRDKASVGLWPTIQTGLSGLPHSFSGAAERRPDRLAELTPIPEMADEARDVAQPPLDVSHGRRLVDAEVVGDAVHVQEPKDEQRNRDRADECERNQDEARDSVGRELLRRRGSRPSRAYAGTGLVVAIGSGYYAAACSRRTATFPPKRRLANGRRSAMMEAWKDVRTKASFTGRFFAARKGVVRPLPSR